MRAEFSKDTIKITGHTRKVTLGIERKLKFLCPNITLGIIAQ